MHPGLGIRDWEFPYVNGNTWGLSVSRVLLKLSEFFLAEEI